MTTFKNAPFDRPTTYEDPWLQATVLPVDGAWRLTWSDGQEGHGEWFPEYHLAKLRLAELVGLDHEAGDVLQPLKEHYQNHLGHGWYYAWKQSEWRDFIEELTRCGWEVELFNSGGGIYLVQVTLLSGALLAWMDDHEGYPRLGLYSVSSDNEVDSEGAMIGWPDSTELDTDVAKECARIFDQITLATDRVLLQQRRLQEAKRGLTEVSR